MRAPRLVVVASANPVKREAARRGLERAFGAVPELTCAAVPSGVPDQPFGDGETLRGARQRARAALAAAPGAGLALGLEGGLVDGPEGMLTFAWVVALDRAGREGRARSASFLVPAAAAAGVRAGLELGTAIDRAFGLEDAKRKGGAVAVATGGRLGRAELYAPAVLLALAPWLADEGGEG